MPPITYVFGHQRPDTDSICAALAYANLKRALGDPGVIACRLGEVNKETQYALDYFNIDPPRLIKSVKPQVSDLNFNNNSKVYETDSVLKTMNLIIGNPGRSVPVVDEGKRSRRRLNPFSVRRDKFEKFLCFFSAVKKTALRHAHRPRAELPERVIAHRPLGRAGGIPSVERSRDVNHGIYRQIVIAVNRRVEDENNVVPVKIVAGHSAPENWRHA